MEKVLKPVKIIIVAGRVKRITRKYPEEPPLLTSEFRGLIRIDPAKCTGCGACVRACPPNALDIVDMGDKIVIKYFIGRCIYCWRCVDICPVKAIKGTREFELATDNIDDLYHSVIHSKTRCVTCNRGFATIRLTRWVIENSPISEEYVHKCPSCRRSDFVKTLSRRKGGV
ncbi:MAG: 4Fe-4S binding protein [Desulfurococcaceae archaeon]